MKLTAAQKQILTTAELKRIHEACQKHTDVERLAKDVRAIRELRQKQQDALADQRRAIKTGDKRPTRSVGLNERTHQKEELFDEVLRDLEARLSVLRSTINDVIGEQSEKSAG